MYISKEKTQQTSEKLRREAAERDKIQFKKFKETFDALDWPHQLEALKYVANSIANSE